MDPPNNHCQTTSDMEHLPRLWASTPFTVASHAATWFLTISLCFMAPLLTACMAYMLHPGLLTILNEFLRENPHIGSLGLVVLYGYCVCLLLCYVHLIAPDLLSLNQMFCFRRFRRHRSHISQMRQDRFKRLVSFETFTIFIQGVRNTSFPLVVTPATTVADVWASLVKRGLVPRVRDAHRHLIGYNRSRPLDDLDTMADLELGPLSHLRLSVPLLGGSEVPDSPSKNTRAQKRLRENLSDDDLDDGSTPRTPRRKSQNHRRRDDSGSESDAPIIISPTKKRRKAANDRSLTDFEVWSKPDEEIIAIARATWTSPAYTHYNVTVERVEKDGKPSHINFVFKCRYDAGHQPQRRARMQTGQGTSNLARTAKTCNAKRGVTAANASARNGQQTLDQSVSLYTRVRHRALIAMRCVVNHRPFQSVEDPLYREEVKLLRPDVQLPSASTVGKDVRSLYDRASRRVKEYFQSFHGAIHLVVDGWTAPLTSSYLGIIIVWYDVGKIWRATLEFIHLTSSHTGVYLASVIADCLRRFGLASKFHSICMDNASNCDKTAEELPKHIPGFRGQARRTRCFPHTVNLVAKAFISFFFKAPKKKPTVKVAATRRKRPQRTQADAGPSTGTRSGRQVNAAEAADAALGGVLFESSSMEDPLDDDDAPLDPMEELLQQLAADDNNEDMDASKVAHDDAVISNVRKQAIQVGEALGLEFSAREEQDALALFPKAAGLARRVKDSSTLPNTFEKLVNLDSEKYTGQKRALTRRVATRWNTDLDCLETHLYFESAVRQLTSNPDNGVTAFALTESQWALARDVAEVLKIFKPLTELFSRKEVPLVHEVLPLLESMEHSLTTVRDDTDAPPIVRVASIAALLVLSKYYALTDDNEIYRVAITMCPNKKLKWFEKNPDWREEDCRLVDEIVRQRFNADYAKQPSAAATDTPSSSGTSARRSGATKKSKYTAAVFDDDDDDSSGSYPLDSIEAYLQSPKISKSELEQAGGVLKYWEAALVNRPQLARFALDYLSAPASSVDAERAFSGGRLQVGHLQHNMSSQTFKARVALSSWYDTPLLPQGMPATLLDEAKSKPSKGKANKKGKERASPSDDDDVEIVS